MSKFNTVPTIKTTNNEGHVAYAMTDESKLVTQVLTSFFNEPKFYGDNSKDIVETAKRVIAKNPEFVSKLAVFARREFNMRSISHMLIACLANIPEGKSYVRKALKGAILRGDDATEILACYITYFGKPIPNSLRRGLSDAIATFDSYTLAKYKGEGNAVKMKDLFKICHPKPENKEQEELWKQVIEGTLPIPYTWETELSTKGNTKEVWEELIASGKVGYMALLRNLRNILNANPDNLDNVLTTLSDPERVRRSRQLPFQFLSAYRNLPASASSKVFDALEKAVSASVDNIDKLPGKTVIAIDVSGSMTSLISAKSTVRCSDIATLLGFIANRICEDAIVYKFDTHIEKLSMPSTANILYSTANSLAFGGGTNLYLPFDKIDVDKIKPDRVIIFSDNEVNYRGRTVQTKADEVRKSIGKDFWVHGVDLCGYGTQQFAGPKTNIIAGWSEKIFKFILLAEQGEETLKQHIAEYTW